MTISDDSVHIAVAEARFVGMGGNIIVAQTLFSWRLYTSFEYSIRALFRPPIAVNAWLMITKELKVLGNVAVESKGHYLCCSTVCYCYHQH